LFEQKFYGLFEQKNSRFSQKTGSIVLNNALEIVLTILHYRLKASEAIVSSTVQEILLWSVLLAILLIEAFLS
jgi:hypothetical protein